MRHYFKDPTLARWAGVAQTLGATMVGTYTVTTACTWTGMYNGAEVTLSFSTGPLTPSAEQQYVLDNFLVPDGYATNPAGQTGPGATPSTPAPPTPAGYVLTADGAGGTHWAAQSGSGAKFNPTTVSGTTHTASSWDLVLVTTPSVATTITMPASPAEGDQVAVFLNGGNGPVTIAANAGQTINGKASVICDDGASIYSPTVVCIYAGSGLWVLLSLANTDAGLGMQIGGNSSLGSSQTSSTPQLLVAGSISIPSGAYLQLWQDPIVITAATYNATGLEMFLRCGRGAATTVNLNTAMPPGIQLCIVNNGTGVMTITPPAGGTIDGRATLLLPGSSAVGVFYDGVNCYTLWGFGPIAPLAPAVTTPTLGAAAQLAQVAQDSMVYIDVTTSGQLTVAIGPTSGVADTIFSGTAPIGLMTLRLPAGWYIAVTTSGSAAWSATAVTC